MLRGLIEYLTTNREERERKKRELYIKTTWYPADIESNYVDLLNPFPVSTGVNGYFESDVLDWTRKKLARENFWVDYKPWYDESQPYRIYFRNKEDLLYIIMLVGDHKIHPVERSKEAVENDQVQPELRRLRKPV